MVRQRNPLVLQLMLSTQSGGAERFFEKLALAFAEAGVPQCLVVEPNWEREQLLRDLPGVRLVPITFGAWKERGARRRLRAVFEEFQPDVALSWMNRASRRVPRGLCPVVGRLGGYYKLKHYRGFDHLVGNTPGVLDYLEASGWSREKMSLISNFGENPDAPRPDGRPGLRAEFGVPKDRKVLVTLGRLHPNKAQDVLIRALGQVPGTELWIAGEGPLRRELEALAAGCGVADRVRFLGWWRDTSALFEAADLCVFPSRAEPLGNVVLEAWAHGVPVVAAASEGPSWLIDDGENGLLFPVDEVEACAVATRRLLADPELAARCVENGSAKWKAGFSKEAVVNQYLELFGRLSAH